MRSNDSKLADLCWPSHRLDEAVERLAISSGLISYQSSNGDLIKPKSDLQQDEDWLDQIQLSAAVLGIEAEPFTSTYGKLETVFKNAAPAIIKLPSSRDGASPFFIVLKATGFRQCEVLTLNLKVIKINPEIILDVFRGPLASTYQTQAEQLLSLTKTLEERKAKVGKALINSWLAADIIPVGWLLRPLPGSNLKVQAGQTGLGRQVFGWIGVFIIQQVLFLVSWWLIGRIILEGKTDQDWMWVWVLLLFSAIPFQMAVNWMQNRFTETVGVLFKQKLLYGALKMNPDQLRFFGTGQILQRVMETDSFEMLAIGGGLTSITALGQLAAAGWVLSNGAGGWWSVLVLTLWVCFIFITGWVNYRRGSKWIDAYRQMTNGLVEKMIGHRTRLAQENPFNRHAGEDFELDHYQGLTRQFSKTGGLLGTIPISWLAVGLACFIPALLSNQVIDMTKMAVGLGGVLFAFQSFILIRSGIQNVVLVFLSWDQVKPIYQVSSSIEKPPKVYPKRNFNDFEKKSNGVGLEEKTTPLLTAHDLNFRFQPNLPPALQNCNLQIYPGDRIILEGPSGGGKTTLGAILSGLRTQDSGLLFLNGYDKQSLGETAWRKRVVMVPQFHENHIFSETFAFNLLMGRRWPPLPEDLDEAETVCNELGLSDLLAHMPSGWQQMVGENGWQLSHGERSRVFIARALLQQADLLIMDESFGALDPENLFLALECANKRATTLLVIAHP